MSPTGSTAVAAPPRTGRTVKLVALLVTPGVVLLMVVLAMVVFPGLFRLTAPVLCPDGQPDPVVVRYEVSTDDGNGTNFTLFCLGEQGDFTEVGTWLPLAVLVGYAFAGMFALMALLLVVRLIRLARRAGGGHFDPTSDFDATSDSASGPIIL